LYHVQGESKGKEVLTYNDYGGALTSADKSGTNITIRIDPVRFQPAMNSGLCDKNENDIPNPVWMVIGHEMGGHGGKDRPFKEDML
jgi:hypothetical protein